MSTFSLHVSELNYVETTFASQKTKIRLHTWYIPPLPPLIALWKEIAGLNPLCWNCCKKAQYSKCIPLLSCQYSSQISCISSHFLYWIATILYWNFIDKCQIPVEQSLAKQSARVLLYIAETSTGCILKNKRLIPYQENCRAVWTMERIYKPLFSPKN